MPHSRISFFQDASTIFSVLSNISDGFAFLDNEWNILFWNKSAERITGVSRENVMYKNVWEQFQIAPDSVNYLEYHRAKRENVTVEFEMFHEPIQIWVEVRAYPMEEGLAVYFKDITAKKLLILKLSHQKKQTEAIINSSADVFYSVDRNFCLLAANKTFVRHCALYSGNQIKVGDCVLEVMGKEEGNKWKPFYVEALKGNPVSHDRLIQYQANGESVYTEIHFNPIKDEETDEIIGVACHARDVTASKRYISLIEDKNAKLQESDAKLQEAFNSLIRQNQTLREIAFIQSHEVRKPLANILGLADALAQQCDGSNQYIKFLKSSGEELDAMIRKIVSKTSEITRHADDNS